MREFYKISISIKYCVNKDLAYRTPLFHPDHMKNVNKLMKMRKMNETFIMKDSM